MAMRHSGHADLPLHNGRVPAWLAQRMTSLGGAIIESILTEYGRAEVLSRLSDPLWFQALGCVMGMDWHSSGITTSVMGALKRAINPHSREWGLFICGGRGKHSRNTPAELLKVGDETGLNGQELVRCSRLAAKVDNTAVQDGFQLYLHSFIVGSDGAWTVVQQGLNDGNGMARRYHWHSQNIRSFVEEPHTAVIGANQGLILNLTAKEAEPTQKGILNLAAVNPDTIVAEARKIILPRRHEVGSEDVNMKRLGAVLTLAHETDIKNFESLLLIEGLGPRTLQSLTLVSEVIHGTPSRFTDPARFAFAHGGKDGHPFPVPIKVYDQTISTLKTAVEKSKVGQADKRDAIKKLSTLAQDIESGFTPKPFLEAVIARERRDAHLYGGSTVFEKARPPSPKGPEQLDLF